MELPRLRRLARGLPRLLRALQALVAPELHDHVQRARVAVEQRRQRGGSCLIHLGPAAQVFVLRSPKDTLPDLKRRLLYRTLLKSCLESSSFV